MDRILTREEIWDVAKAIAERMTIQQAAEAAHLIDRINVILEEEKATVFVTMAAMMAIAHICAKEALKGPEVIH